MVVALEARGFEIHTETVALTTAFDESLQDCDDEFFSAFEQALSVGRTHANEGRYREALETFIHAKQLALEAGQFLDAAETAIGIGEIYALALDEPREAISALLDATDELEILSAFDTANTPVFADERATQGLAYGRRVMAVAIASLDEAQLAASTYQLSEEVYAALGDFGAAGLMAFEAGVVLAGAELNPLSDWDASRKHFAEVNANVRRACVLVTKGFYLLDDDDAAEACEQFLAASNELKALNQEILGLLADGLVAAAGLETQRRDEAISLGERTLAALDEIDRQHGDALYEVLKQEDPEARRVASQDAFLAVFVEQVRAAEPA